MGLHHKLCHTLGGLFNLPHAETHSILLPHALAYNAPAIPVVMEQLSATLNVPDVPGELFDINRAIDAPRGLRDIGMPEGYVERAVDQALSNPYWNPRTLSRDGLIELISRAYRGERPAATGA
jgi:alcohol dehydrogenase class IV